MSVFLGVPTWLCTVEGCKFVTYSSAEIANRHLEVSHKLRSRRNLCKNKIRAITCLLCSQVLHPTKFGLHSHDLSKVENVALRKLITPIQGEQTPLPKKLLEERPILDASTTPQETRNQSTSITFEDMCPDPISPPTLENILAEGNRSYPRHALPPILEKMETLI